MFRAGIVEVNPPNAYADDSNLLREHLRRVLRICKCRTVDLEILEADESDETESNAAAAEDESPFASLRYIVTIEPPKPSADCEFLPKPIPLASLKFGERLDVPDLKASIGRILKSVKASSFADEDYEDELDDDDKEADDVDLEDDDVKGLDSKGTIKCLTRLCEFVCGVLKLWLKISSMP